MRELQHTQSCVNVRVCNMLSLDSSGREKHAHTQPLVISAGHIEQQHVCVTLCVRTCVLSTALHLDEGELLRLVERRAVDRLELLHELLLEAEVLRCGLIHLGRQQSVVRLEDGPEEGVGRAWRTSARGPQA